MDDNRGAGHRQRVGLINTYSTFNLGDAAIYSALSLLLGGGRTIEARVQDAQPHPIPGVSFKARLDPCDLYVSVGGDIFNNSREWSFAKGFLLNVLQLRRDPAHTVLFGQSLPRSCHGPALFLLARYLKRLAAVCVRDAESHDRLTLAGVKARLSWDTAFALRPDPAAADAAEAWLRQRGVDLAEAALISVRAFDTMYAHDNDRFVKQMVGLCRDLERRDLRPVVLVQSHAYAADNDQAVAAAIRAEVPSVAVFDPFAIEAPGLLHWQLAMGALERAAVAVGIRYHTTVLALAAGRLPFNLHYSNKGRDLSQRLALPGCDLAHFEPSAAIASIVATAGRRFDPQPIRSDVRSSFAACLASVPAAGR